MPNALPKCVQTAHGCLATEREYIAGVIECELGSLTDAAAALEAQAIAARTYVATYLAKNGLQAQVPTSPRFQCWRPPRRSQSIRAAEATAGLLLLWRGELISANYVAGTRRLSALCSAKPPERSGYPYTNWASLLKERRRSSEVRKALKGTDWTEIYVTNNEGRRGRHVLHTPIGLKVPNNRGALSQNGAMCLARQRGYETMAILAYYYGSDIQLAVNNSSLRYRARGHTSAW